MPLGYHFHENTPCKSELLLKNMPALLALKGIATLLFYKERPHLHHIDVNGEVIHSFSKDKDHDWTVEE